MSQETHWGPRISVQRAANCLLVLAWASLATLKLSFPASSSRPQLVLVFGLVELLVAVLICIRPTKILAHAAASLLCISFILSTYVHPDWLFSGQRCGCLGPTIIASPALRRLVASLLLMGSLGCLMAHRVREGNHEKE